MPVQANSARQIYEQLDKLVVLLELEQEALKNRQFDTINTCAKDKEIALIGLEKLEQQRLQFIQTHSGSNEKQPPFEADERAEALLNRCRELNTINGGIVEISRQFNQRMLESILDSNISENKLYDETGNKPRNSHRQVVAKI
ncbi:MAG: hypothetical protein GKR93_17825 [Gammaproteobacteria bacterium]|nr:hypothetical protein [Gammaproteobacteria bacterium]